MGGREWGDKAQSTDSGADTGVDLLKLPLLPVPQQEESRGGGRRDRISLATCAKNERIIQGGLAEFPE